METKQNKQIANKLAQSYTLEELRDAFNDATENELRKLFIKAKTKKFTLEKPFETFYRNESGMLTKINVNKIECSNPEDPNSCITFGETYLRKTRLYNLSFDHTPKNTWKTMILKYMLADSIKNKLEMKEKKIKEQKLAESTLLLSEEDVIRAIKEYLIKHSVKVNIYDLPTNENDKNTITL